MVNHAILAAAGVVGDVSVPVITGSANVDTTSIDIILAALPTSATSVRIYKKSNNGYDTLVGTLTAAGTVNDDNSGVGYDSRQFIEYGAYGFDDDGGSSYMSREIGVEVGEYTVGKRELVKQSIMDDIEAITIANGYPVEVVTVSDKLRHPEKIDTTEFPIVFVTTGQDQTEYIASQRVQVTLTLSIYGYIWSADDEDSRDTDLNTLIHAVKKALISDDAKFRNESATLSDIDVTDTFDAGREHWAYFAMEIDVMYRQDDLK